MDYIKRTKQELNEERAFMYNALDAIEGITVYPPSANFILFQVNQEGITANYINEELKNII